MRSPGRALAVLGLLCCLLLPAAAAAQEGNRVTLNLRDVDLAEAMAMLAKQKRLNILLSEGVQGSLSLNLYDVPVSDAIHAIANAAGYAVEQRAGTYFVMNHDQVGQYTNSGLTRVQAFDVHYADPLALEDLLEPYLSRYGTIKAIPERKLILVTDRPEFLRRISALVRYADAKPAQVVIEARILEVSLNEEDAYGIDWAKLFESQDGTGAFGTQGFAGAGGSGSSGFFFDYVNPNIDLLLTALEQDGRLRTLSTPKLVALDNEEAEVIIGDRRGYAVTTTINQVTTESIEFLESGVILRVTPHIDANGHVLMDIHPEVSTGTVDAAGIPSQTTTEVTTSLLVPSGETVFIGGLMKHSTTQSYRRVPVLGRVPGLKALFSSREETQVNTETIVLITPRVVESFAETWNRDAIDKVDKAADFFAEREELLVGGLDAEAEERYFGLAGRGDRETQPPQPADAEGPDQSTTRIAPGAAAAPDANVEAGDQAASRSRGSSAVADGASGELARVDEAALRSLPGSLYTVQLMTMVSRERLLGYQAEHGLQELPVVPQRRGDRTRYALLLGVYRSVAEAESAIDADVPPHLLENGPWVRSLSSVQAAMPAADGDARPGAGDLAAGDMP